MYVRSLDTYVHNIHVMCIHIVACEHKLLVFCSWFYKPLLVPIPVHNYTTYIYAYRRTLCMQNFYEIINFYEMHACIDFMKCMHVLVL